MSLWSPLTQYGPKTIGAAKTGSSSNNGKNRLENRSNVTLEPEEQTIPDLDEWTAYQKARDEERKKNGTNSSGNENLGAKKPTGFKFNLPPHKWSLPTMPTVVDSVINKRKPIVLNPNRDMKDFHGLRRGRMWWYNTQDIISAVKNNQVTLAAGKYADGTPAGSAADIGFWYGKENKNGNFNLDRKWGFHFLWNPEAISTSVEVNMEVTPASTDRLRAVSGAFPGMEYINLTLVLDRTNDFACIRAGHIKPIEIPLSNWAKYEPYYSGMGFPGESTEIPMVDKIRELAKKGTVADLEYFFKMINGSGAGGENWRNLLGRETADIGFLQPTLVAMQFGPSGTNNLSYVGWIKSVNINHVAFTQNMVPIRTTVQMSIHCFAGAGIISVG